MRNEATILSARMARFDFWKVTASGVAGDADENRRYTVEIRHRVKATDKCRTIFEATSVELERAIMACIAKVDGGSQKGGKRDGRPSLRLAGGGA